jgi:[ribosomal protein S5]-alanine N-acetyltransferase
VSDLKPVTTGVGPRSVRLVVLPLDALRALVDGDLPAASAATGVRLSAYLVSEECQPQWRRRIAQIEADPESARWVARAVQDTATDEVVGRAGYHGPPDASGMVEIGYAVDPMFRRRGFARAIVEQLLSRSESEPGVHVVRAAIRPDNEASLATIAGFGFSRIGEQWDDQDGLEILFERRTGTRPRPPGPDPAGWSSGDLQP